MSLRDVSVGAGTERVVAAAVVRPADGRKY